VGGGVRLFERGEWGGGGAVGGGVRGCGVVLSTAARTGWRQLSSSLAVLGRPPGQVRAGERFYYATPASRPALIADRTGQRGALPRLLRDRVAIPAGMGDTPSSCAPTKPTRGHRDRLPAYRGPVPGNERVPFWPVGAAAKGGSTPTAADIKLLLAGALLAGRIGLRRSGLPNWWARSEVPAEHRRSGRFLGMQQSNDAGCWRDTRRGILPHPSHDPASRLTHTVLSIARTGRGRITARLDEILGRGLRTVKTLPLLSALRRNGPSYDWGAWGERAAGRHGPECSLNPTERLDADRGLGDRR